jgi:hypothetical protein
MEVNFITRGRLGNAIFRYFACALMCILYNGKYKCKNFMNTSRQNDFGENNFVILQNALFKNEMLVIKNLSTINMDSFYQYDKIYRLFKDRIIRFIQQNPDHIVETDGINAGDGRYEQFTMLSIIETPNNFNKKYKNVLHIRLEDFVTHNLYIKVERVIQVLENILDQLVEKSLCIVCKTPSTDFEINYINSINKFLETKNIITIQESNDVLTDYYIMKNAELLICSKSTLSWCAALLSTTIKTCYVPEGESFKYPIDNTSFY